MNCVDFTNDYVVITQPTQLRVFAAAVEFYNQSDGVVFINGLKLPPYGSHCPHAALENERDISVYQIVFDSAVTQPAVVVIQKHRI